MLIPAKKGAAATAGKPVSSGVVTKPKVTYLKLLKILIYTFIAFLIFQNNFPSQEL